MKKLGETELLKGQPSPVATAPKLEHNTKTLRELTVHFLVLMYQATQSAPTWIEPGLIFFNLVCVVTSHIELGRILMVGAADSIFTGYIVQMTGTWIIFGFACFVYWSETNKARIMYLLPSYKPDVNRQTYLLAMAFQVQTYLFTPRLSTAFLMLMSQPEQIWPGITNDPYYWAHLAATGISTLLAVAVAFCFFSYCKLPLPGNRSILASNSVINEVILMIFPIYAFLTTTVTKQLFILRRSSPALVIMIHMFKSVPSYFAIFTNLTSVVFYNRGTRELLVWVHMVSLSIWALVLFIYDVSAKNERFLSLMMCLLAPLFITSLVRLGAALDSRVSNPAKLPVVITLAEICLLEASGKLSPLEDKKAEYLKNYYFHQEKLQKIGSTLPKKLSEAEKLIIAVFEHLLTRTKAKSGEAYLHFLHYLISIDAGVSLPLKIFRKLLTDGKKQKTLKWNIFFEVIIMKWQAKLDSMTIEQDLFKIGKSDFSNLDCSPINPHLSLIQVPSGHFARRNLDALLLFDRLTEFMEHEIKLLKELFSLLTKSDCQVRRLQKLATKIHEVNSKCQSVFELVDNSCPGVNTFHLLPYAMFSHHTSNNNRLMRDMLHQFHLRKKSRLNPRLNLPFLSVKDHSSFFVSSAETNTIGDIMYACGRLDKVLTGSDSKNIFAWLPDGLQLPHKGVLTQYMAELDKPYLGVKTDRVLRVPGSSVYLPQQIVSLFGSSLRSGLQFFICIEEAEKIGEFVLFDENYRVCGFSSSLAKIGDRLTEGLSKRTAGDISNALLSLMQAQSGQVAIDCAQSKPSIASGTTASMPSEISTLMPGIALSPLITDGEILLSLGNDIQVSCKMKDITLRVLGLTSNQKSAKVASPSKIHHFMVNFPKEVWRQLSKISQQKTSKPKFMMTDKKSSRIALFAPERSNPDRTSSLTAKATKLRVVATAALFVARLRRCTKYQAELMSLKTYSKDPDSFEMVNKIGLKRRGGSKKTMLSEQLLAKFDNRFAKVNKEEIDAADSINTHKQIMYDARSLTIRHISPKSIIFWPIIGLSLVILTFWIGMVYCYYLEVIFMGGKAATLLDARLVQSLLVKSRWSVWQTIDGVVEKISYDKKYLAPDRFKLIGIDLVRDWNQVYLEGAQRWPRDQVNYLLQVEKLPETSIDTINQFVYKTNITLGSNSSVFITKSLTLSNILYFVSHQVRKLYNMLPKVDFRSTDYAKAITLIEDGSPATVSKYADQIVVVEGNKFAETQLQISTTVTAIMLVSEGLFLFLVIVGWLIGVRISDVYQTFTLLEDREIQFKKDRLEHFQMMVKNVGEGKLSTLITMDQKSKDSGERKNILSRRSRRFRPQITIGFGNWVVFFGLFCTFQASLICVYQLTQQISQLFEVQNETTTNFRSFGKMMYQHRAAYHMIFDATLIKAGVGKNVNITTQLTKLNNILNNMKSFQSEMERFYRQNQFTDIGKKYTHIQLLFDPCGNLNLEEVFPLSSDSCRRLADGTLGQDFMSVMNWAISTTDHFLNAVRNTPKDQVLALLTHYKYLNLEYLVKKFYYPFYTEFANRFKESIQNDSTNLITKVGKVSWVLILVASLLGLLFTILWVKVVWTHGQRALDSLKYMPEISLLYNAHLKLKLKKYAPKYM